jgi:hypothetical protein
MPNQAHSGIRGDPWHRCDRCGKDYRVSSLRKVTTLMHGTLILCSATCIDEEIDRDAIIERFLLTQPQDAQPAEILRQPAPPLNRGT